MLRSVAHLLLDAPADGNLYGRENGTWMTMPTSSGGIPEAPTDGQVYGRVGSTTSWLPVVVTASTAPASPAVGQLWWDSIDGNTYIYYNDGTSSQWVPAVATAVASGGPFLATTGGSMTGPLNWISTGSTTSRAAQDRTAEIINVKDYGAKGDGTTDDTTAIKAAMAAGVGKTVYLPAGTYKVSGNPTIIHSNTRVVGDGREVSIIRPNGLTPWTFPGGTDIVQVFAGNLYAQLGPWISSPTPPGGVYDTDIAIEGIGFDFTQQANVSVGIAIASFLFAQRVMLANLALWSTTGASTACTGVRCLACDRVTMHDSRGDNVMQMLDCWAGTTRVKISNLDVVGCPGGGNGGIFNLQGVGVVNSSSHSYQYEATNINVQLNGGGVFFLDSMGAGSITSDVLLDNINIVAVTGVNGAVVGRGRGGRIKIHNMNCTAQTGASWQMPILIGGFFSYQNTETGPNKITTTSGSNIITVTFANGTDAGVGNYVSIGGTGTNNSLVGNGLTLGGSYLILGITTTVGNYNTVVTCDARANATATGPITATTSIIGYQGCFSNCELNGITFDGAQSGSQPVVNIAGNGHQISNLNVTTNYGASTTPQYTVLIATDGTSIPAQYETQRAISIDNVEGAPGAGPVPSGYSGDTVVSWNPYAPTPIKLNVNGSTALTGSSSAGVAQPNYITIAGGAAGSPATITTAGPWAGIDLSPALNGHFQLSAWRQFAAPDGLPEAVRWNYSLGGTVASGQSAEAETHSVNADNANASNAMGGGMGWFNYSGNISAGAVGGRTGFGMNMVQSGATTCPSGQFYVAGAFWVQASHSAGGTAGNTMGSLFAANDLVKLQTGAGLYWEEIIGYELDVSVQAGTGCSYKHGMKIITGSDDVVSGHAGHDYAYSLGAQAGAVGWDVGYAFGDSYSTWPMKATGTLIGTIPGSGGPAYAAAWGVDFSQVAFSGGLIRGPSYSVDGSGHVTAAGFQANSAGIYFGAQYASTYSDLSKHIDLYNGQVGISYTNNTAMNLVSGGGAAFYAGTTELALLYSGGLILYTGGLSCPVVNAANNTDLSKHINLYNGQIGINVGPTGAMRLVAVAAGIGFNISGADIGYMAAEGLENMAIGASYPSTGNFTRAAFSSGVTFGSYVAASPTDLSHHIDLYGGQYGLSVTGATVNIVVGGTAIANISNLTNGITSIGQMQIFGTSGPTWTSGTTAPSSTQPVGSLYSRVGGAVGATLYVSRGAGTWAAVAGV